MLTTNNFIKIHCIITSSYLSCHTPTFFSEAKYSELETFSQTKVAKTKMIFPDTKFSEAETPKNIGKSLETETQVTRAGAAMTLRQPCPIIRCLTADYRKAS